MAQSNVFSTRTVTEKSSSGDKGISLFMSGEWNQFESGEAMCVDDECKAGPREQLHRRGCSESNAIDIPGYLNCDTRGRQPVLNYERGVKDEESIYITN